MDHISKTMAAPKQCVSSNRILEKIFYTTDCGILCHSADGTQILSINKAALKILGYHSQEELIADGFDLISLSVAEEDRHKLRSAIQELKQVGDSNMVLYRVRRKNGELREVMGGIKLLEEDGQRFYQRFLLDCTKQRSQEKMERREQELRQMQMIYALSSEYTTVIYADLDADEGIIYRMPEEIKEEYGAVFESKCPLEEKVAYYIQAMVHPEDREMLRQAATKTNLKRKLSVERTLHLTYRVVKNGRVEYYRVKAVRVGDWWDSYRVVMGFRNVDEEVCGEVEKRRLLEDAVLKAEQGSQAKSTFLNNMSHDIRTPMNAIIGFAELANDHIDNKARVQDYLQKILTASNHLLSLINDVLDMSRIESGKMCLENAPCRLSQLMDDLKTVMLGQAQAKQLELTMETVNVRNDAVCCDKLRLDQVLLNLLSNAVKFTPSGGNISVQLIQKQKEGLAGRGAYQFRVKDNGIGMSREFLDHAFEQFSRERTTTASGVPGTGLGLAIAKNLVDMMGGTIQVYSQKGQGSEFVIDLELELQEQPQCPAYQKEAEGLYTRAAGWNSDACAGSAQRQSGQASLQKTVTGKRVLLVEDNELNREIATEILTDFGLVVESAEDGSVAVDMVGASQPGHYDVVLMDVQMPVMNGYEAARRIRQLSDPKLSAVPIIAMTANAFDEDQRQAAAAGMNGYVTKPIDVTKLIETLENLCD